MTPTTRLPLVERLRQRASRWKLNSDKAWVNTPLGGIREAAALIEKQGAVIAGLSQAASNAAMYLKSGFIECDRCGHEVETKHTDAEYELRAALLAAKTSGERE